MIAFYLSGLIPGILLGIVLGMRLEGYFAKKMAEDPELSRIDALDLTEHIEKPISIWVPEDAAGFTTKEKVAREYAVTGSPRHIPWSRRRKELEQEARQKRRQLESFREPQ